jgi:hypothetical protein
LWWMCLILKPFILRSMISTFCKIPLLNFYVSGKFNLPLENLILIIKPSSTVLKATRAEDLRGATHRWIFNLGWTILRHRLSGSVPFFHPSKRIIYFASLNRTNSNS